MDEFEPGAGVDPVPIDPGFPGHRVPQSGAQCDHRAQLAAGRVGELPGLARNAQVAGGSVHVGDDPAGAHAEHAAAYEHDLMGALVGPEPAGVVVDAAELFDGEIGIDADDDVAALVHAVPRYGSTDSVR